MGIHMETNGTATYRVQQGGDGGDVVQLAPGIRPHAHHGHKRRATTYPSSAAPSPVACCCHMGAVVRGRLVLVQAAVPGEPSAWPGQRGEAAPDVEGRADWGADNEEVGIGVVETMAVVASAVAASSMELLLLLQGGRAERVQKGAEADAVPRPPAAISRNSSVVGETEDLLLLLLEVVMARCVHLPGHVHAASRTRVGLRAAAAAVHQSAGRATAFKLGYLGLIPTNRDLRSSECIYNVK